MYSACVLFTHNYHKDSCYGVQFEIVVLPHSDYVYTQKHWMSGCVTYDVVSFKMEWGKITLGNRAEGRESVWGTKNDIPLN